MTKSINKRKLLYRKFLIELLKIFKRKFKLNAIISFNLFYKSDREIQEASKAVGIKFFRNPKRICAFAYRRKNNRKYL